MITNSKKRTFADGLKIFGNIKVLVITALFIAMSIVLGKFLSFTVGPIRLSFENLTVLMSGIMFGPIIGLITGMTADIIGCILYGYAINPIITFGAAAIGFIAGLVSTFSFKKNLFLKILFSVVLAHIVGSLIIKSIGLYVYYKYPMEAVILRIPTYVIISTAEFYIIYLVMKNKSLMSQMNKVLNK